MCRLTSLTKMEFEEDATFMSDADFSKESQFMLNCTSLSEKQLKTVNLIRGVTSAICMSVLLVIILILFCYKLCKSVIQRLFLYVVITTAIKEALHFASIEHQWKYSAQEVYCTWHGFLTNITVIAVLLMSLSLILYLLYQVYRLRNCDQIKQSKSCEITLEVLFTAIPILASFLYSLGPLIRGTYGLAATWCWIQSVDENCTNIGLVDQIVFGHGPNVVIGIVVTLIVIVNIAIYCKLSSNYQNARLLLKKTLLLTGCLLVRILLFVIILVDRVVRATEPKKNIYPVSISQAMATPICDLVFPFGFLLFFYSARRLIVRAVSKYCCSKCNLHQKMYVQINKTLEEQTCPPSTRQTQPSESFFNVSHTDGFSSTAPEVKNELH